MGKTRAMGLMTLALIIGAWASPATAQVCEPSQIQESLQYLRKASIDLRGTLPTLDELESVVANGEVDPLIIEEMIESSDFEAQLRKYHLDLLWTNVENQRLAGAAWILASQGNRNPAYWVPNRGNRYRGSQVSCKDEPAQFGSDGTILTTAHPSVEGAVQEGWVEVTPYWDTSNTVRVCAFDAQDNATGATARNPDQRVECNASVGSAECGCGPNLSWCQTGGRNGFSTSREILRSFAEQLLRFSDDIIVNDRPYTDFLLGTDMEINGPLAHYLKFQSRTGGVNFLSFPIQNYEVPEDLTFEDTDWVKIQRNERHAGVLTMPGYLVKFQTNRSRANRFYNAFLCQYFEAPPGGLPASDDACNDEPNLTKRCGCKHCHLTVEPAASHWGRFGEAGLAALNEDLFPTLNELCLRQGARNAQCRFFYLTEATHPDEEPYLGMLLPYVFADEVMEENIEAGPALLAQQSIEGGAFARCTTRKMWENFMGREALAEDEPTIEALSEEFTADNYNLRSLVTKIVTRPEYIEGESFGTKE